MDSKSVLFHFNGLYYQWSSWLIKLTIMNNNKVCQSAFVSATATALVSQPNDWPVSLISSRSASVQSTDFKIWQKVDRMKTECFPACCQLKTLHCSWYICELSIQLKGLWSISSANAKDQHQKLTKVKTIKWTYWWTTADSEKSAILAMHMNTQVSCYSQN